MTGNKIRAGQVWRRKTDGLLAVVLRPADPKWVVDLGDPAHPHGTPVLESSIDKHFELVHDVEPEKTREEHIHDVYRTMALRVGHQRLSPDLVRGIVTEWERQQP